MALEFSVFILIVACLAILALFVFKRLGHKILALALIGLVLFSYFGFSSFMKENEIESEGVPGFIEASKLYFSWLASSFGNFKQITSRAIEVDWGRTNKLEGFESEFLGYNISVAQKQKS